MGKKSQRNTGCVVRVVVGARMCFLGPVRAYPLNQTLCHISKPVSLLVSNCAIDINNIKVTATPLRSSMR